MHGHLGKHVRRVIPACVILKIRARFPEDDGNYFGFLEADDGRFDHSRCKLSQKGFFQGQNMKKD